MFPGANPEVSNLRIVHTHKPADGEPSVSSSYRLHVQSSGCRAVNETAATSSDRAEIAAILQSDGVPILEVSNPRLLAVMRGDAFHRVLGTCSDFRLAGGIAESRIDPFGHVHRLLGSVSLSNRCL